MKWSCPRCEEEIESKSCDEDGCFFECPCGKTFYVSRYMIEEAYHAREADRRMDDHA
jgi:hypothetical protein